MTMGPSGRLQKVATMLSRPVRIARGQSINKAPLNIALFEVEEEDALYNATVTAASQIVRDMSIGEFLQVRAYSHMQRNDNCCYSLNSHSRLPSAGWLDN